MRFKKMLGMCAALAFTAIGGTAARAASVTATFTSVAHEKDVHFHLNGLGDEYVAVGDYMWQGIASNPIGLQDSFATFCIDFQQDINYGQQYTYTTATLSSAPQGGNNQAGGMGAERADAIRELWGLHFGEIGTDANKIAGFQMAIWELINEDPGQASLAPGDLDLSSGVFYATDGGTATTYANQYLSSLFDTGGQLRTDALATNLGALASSTAQDQIFLSAVPIQDRVPPAAPLPSSAAAGFGLLGIAAVGAVRRRRVAVKA